MEEEGVKIRRVNPEKQDHKILAPLNGMCKFIRSQVMKEIVMFDKKSQDGEKELRIRVTAAQLNKVLKDIMKEHNFKRKVLPYHKTPATVSIEDVNEINELNKSHNESL